MARELTPGERIDLLREQKGWKQAELAERIGVHPSQISRIKTGNTASISSDILIALAKEFGVSADYILGLTPISTPKNSDISELGLSEVAVRKLLDGTINTDVLNRLMEHKDFPFLLKLIQIYFCDTAALGIASRNESMDFLIELLTEYGEEHPEYDVVDQIITIQENGATYPQFSSQSIWKIVAKQATDKLTDGGFVWTNNILGTYSDMAGSIKGAITKETWDKQQQDIWESLLIQMLQETHEGGSSSIEILNKISDKTSSIAEKAQEYAGGMNKASKKIDQSIKQIDEWLDSLAQEADIYNGTNDLLDLDIDKANAIGRKRAQLRTLRNEYSDSLSETNSSGNTAKKIGYIMEAVSIFTAGLSAEKTVAERNDAFEAMLVEGEKNLDILNSIIKTANSTGNNNLSEAANNVKSRLEKELEKRTNQFLTECGAFIEGATAAFTEQATIYTIEALIEAASEKALLPLTIIELGAKGLNWVVGWGEAYDAAEELMTISIMDSTLNILGTLKKDDSQYVAELWGYLQMLGCEKAEDFLEEWEKAHWLSTKEFGIGKEKLPSALLQLNGEKQSFEVFVENQIK